VNVSEIRVLVAELLDLFLAQPIESVVEIAAVTSLVLVINVPSEVGAYYEDESSTGQIDGISRKVLRSKVACIGPSTDDGADCSKTWNQSGCNTTRLWIWDIIETPREEEWSKRNATSEA
jgi:hypothetical protein